MTAGGPLRVAAAQLVAAAGDVAANVEAAARVVRLAGSQGVRVLVLPEAFLTGYDVDVFAGPLPGEDDLDGPWLAPLVGASAETGVVVVCSTPLRRAATATLTMLVVRPDGPDGPVADAYDKQHLDGDETPYFTPGSRGASLVVDGVELGLAICYDSSFPEHARAAAVDGAVGYLCSAAFFPGSAHRRDVALAARALDNAMYVVMAGATGRTGRQDFIGGSAVYGPDGVPIARLGEEEGLAVADLDPGAVAAARAARPLLADRRADLGDRVRVR